MQTAPNLIVFSGLPGVGKTTIAKLLSARLEATYLRIDSIETALKRSALRIENAKDGGYQAANSVAIDNLNMGKTVVADSVNPVGLTRNAWIDVAKATNADLINIEIICSDKIEHRRRVETRRADIQGHRLPTWKKVVQRKYDDWQDEVVRVDTAIMSADECVEVLLKAILKH